MAATAKYGRWESREHFVFDESSRLPDILARRAEQLIDSLHYTFLNVRPHDDWSLMAGTTASRRKEKREWLDSDLHEIRIRLDIHDGFSLKMLAGMERALFAEEVFVRPLIEQIEDMPACPSVTSWQVVAVGVNVDAFWPKEFRP